MSDINKEFIQQHEETLITILDRLEALEKKLKTTIEKTVNHIEYQILLNESWQKEIAELKEAGSARQTVLREMILDDPMNDKMNYYLEKLDSKASGGEKEPIECHSEKMGVDSSMDNSKLPEPKEAEPESHALDALLHATAPIPITEVRKLIDDSNKELIEEFLKRFDWILDRVVFYTENPDSELMDELTEEYITWQGRLNK